MEPWRTAIATSVRTHIWIRGHDVTTLMRESTFTDTDLPAASRPAAVAWRTAAARRHPHRRGGPRLRRAVLCGRAARRVGKSSVAVGGDRRRCSGDRRRARRRRLRLHGTDRRGLARARQARRSFEEAARRSSSAEAAAAKTPGCPGSAIVCIGPIDPRVVVLFDMARAEGLAGDGIPFMRALEAGHPTRIKPLPMNIDGALGGDPARHGLSVCCWAAALHHRSRRRADGGSAGGVRARKADAHQVPVDYDGAPPEPDRSDRNAMRHGDRDLTAEETARRRRTRRARARRDGRDRAATTRPRSIGCARPSRWAGGNEQTADTPRQHERGRERHGQPRADAAAPRCSASCATRCARRAWASSRRFPRRASSSTRSPPA